MPPVNIKTLQQHLDFSPSHSFVVSQRILDDLPGYVISIEIHRPFRVCLAIEPYGFEDGGEYFWGEYDALETLVSDIEEYTEVKIADWDEPATYPERRDATQIGYSEFLRLLNSGVLALPQRASYIRQA